MLLIVPVLIIIYIVLRNSAEKEHRRWMERMGALAYYDAWKERSRHA
jgi:hypothetical protein